mgnify:CR=1 FL=1
MELNWKPAHTAPKIHGDHILVWSKEHGLCSGEWVSEDLYLVGWDKPGWMVTPVHGFDSYAGDKAWDDLTHWMPSPPDPT